MISTPGSSLVAQAIAYAEGGPDQIQAGSPLGNPGDLESGGSLIDYGGNLQSGYDALERQISKWMNGTSANAGPNTPLSQLAAIYTGNQNAQGWAAAIKQYLHLDQSSDPTISELVQAGAQAATGQIPSATLGAALGGSPTIQKAISALSPSNWFSEVLSSRLLFAVIGLILIFGGVLGFKSVREPIIETVKTAKNTAATVAAASEAA